MMVLIDANVVRERLIVDQASSKASASGPGR